MLKTKSLRDESSEELKSKRDILKGEIYELHGDKERARAKPHLIGEKRKEVARIMTVLREREIEQVGKSS